MKKEFIAKKEELDNVISFIHNELEKDLDMKTMTKIDLVTEEIFINIASYGYKETEKGIVNINIEHQNNKIIITFEDSGIPFNPLLTKDPDIKQSVEDRELGGLGIYMVKKMMDNVKYLYKDNKKFSLRTRIFKFLWINDQP